MDQRIILRGRHRHSIGLQLVLPRQRHNAEQQAYQAADRPDDQPQQPGFPGDVQVPARDIHEQVIEGIQPCDEMDRDLADDADPAVDSQPAPGEVPESMGQKRLQLPQPEHIDQRPPSQGPCGRGSADRGLRGHKRPRRWPPRRGRPSRAGAHRFHPPGGAERHTAPVPHAP